MDLNATAGRGGDPSNVLRSAGAQQSRSHDGWKFRSGIGSQGGHRASPVLPQQHGTSAPVGLGSHGLGFVPANLALEGDDGATAVVGSWDGGAEGTEGRGRGEQRQSWDGLRGGGRGYLGDAPARPAGGYEMSNGSGSGVFDRDHADQSASASWQPAVKQAGGGSRWGVFASDRVMGGPGRHNALDPQVLVP